MISSSPLSPSSKEVTSKSIIDEKIKSTQEKSPSQKRIKAKPKFKRDKYDMCVVGCGLSGSVIAERYASQLNKSVLVIEKRDHIGGNCYDCIDPSTNMRVNKYGVHVFHAKPERVYNCMQLFSNWTKYEYQVLGYVHEKYVPIPVNITTVNTLFNTNINAEDEMIDWLNKEKLNYKHFDDAYQCLPTNGCTTFFQNMHSAPNIELHLNIDYFDVQCDLKNIIKDKIYFTGPIDNYYSHLGT